MQKCFVRDSLFKNIGSRFNLFYGSSLAISEFRARTVAKNCFCTNSVITLKHSETNEKTVSTAA